jgi:hypothetical protein
MKVNFGAGSGVATLRKIRALVVEMRAKWDGFFFPASNKLRVIMPSNARVPAGQLVLRPRGAERKKQ